MAPASHFSDNRYIRKGTRIIQVEIDQQELGRNYPVEVGILGDAKAVTRPLLQLLEEALSAQVPTLIEIPIDPEELPYPARAADVLKDKTPTFKDRA